MNARAESAATDRDSKPKAVVGVKVMADHRECRDQDGGENGAARHDGVGAALGASQYRSRLFEGPLARAQELRVRAGTLLQPRERAAQQV